MSIVYAMNRVATAVLVLTLTIAVASPALSKASTSSLENSSTGVSQSVERGLLSWGWVSRIPCLPM